MRKKSFWIIALICAVTLIGLAGCENPASSSGDEKVQLAITISPQQGSEAVAPDTSVFTKYVLVFSGPGSQAPIEAAGTTVAVDLIPGDWTITVTGFVGGDGIAEGTESVTVNSGGTNQATILLGPKASGVNGTFSYKVTVPSAFQSAELEILGLKKIKLTAAVSEEDCMIYSGTYTVEVRLFKDNKYAVFSDDLHIYAGQTTRLEKAFADENLVKLGITTSTAPQRITFLNNLTNQTDFPQVRTDAGQTSFTGNYRPDQSWDCYGWSDDGKLYFGWTTYNGLKRMPNDAAVNSNGSSPYTGTRGGASQEDFLIFSYDPSTQRVTYIDSFMEASRRQNNLRWHDGSNTALPHSEETPKGHTRFVNIGDGYLYMASQPFHDWKQYLTRSDDVFPFPLEDFRGGKIFRLDPRTDTLVDLSATMTGTEAPGVTVEHDGIIALDYMKSTGYLVGLTHPNGRLVFVDPVENKVVRYATGIPWTLQGLTVGRDFAIDDIHKRIYLSRGNEGGSADGTGRDTRRDVYVYDWDTDTTTMTGSQVWGGMWGTSVVTPDGKAAYVTACGGQLFKIDFTTGKTTHEVFLNPFAEAGNLGQLYWIIPSPDWTKLYSMPSLLNNATQNGLWEYDLVTKQKRMVYTLGSGNANSKVYTSQKDLLRDGKLYTIATGNNSWNSSSADFATNSANCILFVFDLTFNVTEY